MKYLLKLDFNSLHIKQIHLPLNWLLIAFGGCRLFCWDPSSKIITELCVCFVSANAEKIPAFFASFRWMGGLLLLLSVVLTSTLSVAWFIVPSKDLNHFKIMNYNLFRFFLKIYFKLTLLIFRKHFLSSCFVRNYIRYPFFFVMIFIF